MILGYQYALEKDQNIQEQNFVWNIQFEIINYQQMGWGDICHGTDGLFLKRYALFEKVYKLKCQKIRKVQIAECQGKDSSNLSNDDTSKCVEEDDSIASDSINNIDSCSDLGTDNDRNGESHDMEKEYEEMAVDANDVLYILEMMLLFHACYKCGEPFQSCSDQNRCHIHSAISQMLNTIKCKIPHTIWNGWKFQKFYDFLHIS